MQAVCDRVVIINKGKIAAIDTPKALSHKLANSSKLSLTYEGPLKEAMSKLSTLPGILAVAPIIENPKIQQIEITINPDADVRKAIFYSMASSSWPILGIQVAGSDARRNLPERYDNGREENGGNSYMKAIYKRELASYFRSPIGWVVIALFSLIGGSYFSIFMSTTGKIDLRSELDLLQMFLVIIIPIMTMRLFSEEKKRTAPTFFFIRLPCPWSESFSGSRALRFDFAGNQSASDLTSHDHPSYHGRSREYHDARLSLWFYSSSRPCISRSA